MFLLEKQIYDLLNKNNIKFVQQYSPNFIGLKSLDFYLTDYNLAIECQGGQHFSPIDFFGGKQEFLNLLQRDQEKFNECLKNGIKVLYFTDDGYEDHSDYHEESSLYFNNIFTSDVELLKRILS